MLIAESFGTVATLEYLASLLVTFQVQADGKLDCRFRQNVDPGQLPRTVILVNSILGGFNLGLESYLRASGQIRVNPGWEPRQDELNERMAGDPAALAELVNNSLYLRRLNQRLAVACQHELFPSIIHIAGNEGAGRLAAAFVTPEQAKWGRLGKLARARGHANGDGVVEIKAALGLGTAFAGFDRCASVIVEGANHIDTAAQSSVKWLIQELVAETNKPDGDPVGVIRKKASGQAEATGKVVTGRPEAPLKIQGKPTEMILAEVALLGLMFAILAQEKFSGRGEAVREAEKFIDTLDLAKLPENLRQRVERKLAAARQEGAGRVDEHQIIARAIVADIESKISAKPESA